MPNPYLEKIAEARRAGQGLSRPSSTPTPETTATIGSLQRRLGESQPTPAPTPETRANNSRIDAAIQEIIDRSLGDLAPEDRRDIARLNAQRGGESTIGPNRFIEKQPLGLPTGEVVYEASKEGF